LYCVIRFDVVDDVVGGDWVDCDRGSRRVDANVITAARTVGAARRIRAADRSGDRLTRNGAAGHINAVCAVCRNGAVADFRVAHF
jgi:hypothetical protein